MEAWTLDHPTLGTIRVERGCDVEFRALHPDWPQDPPTDDDGTVTTVEDPGPSAGLRQRLGAYWHNPTVRLQVSVDGTVVGRYKALREGRVPLQAQGSVDELSAISGVVDRSGPHLRIQPNFFDELLEVEFREGPTVVEFDPPPGSRAERRRRAMESSNLKRIAYPMLTGVGKVGWALLVLVLGPLLGRLVPDWHVHLPSPPQIHLPVPPDVHLHLPVPHWPTVHWPSMPHLPQWLVWLLDHDQLWKPVVVGLVVGVLAVRNHRRSEREKKAWAGRPTDAPDD